MEETVKGFQKEGMTFNESYLSYPVKEFLDTLAGKSAVPGGGSACALTASLGASALVKVASIAISGRDAVLSPSETVERQAFFTDAIETLENIRDRIEVVVDSDPRAFMRLASLWDKSRAGAAVSSDEKEAAFQGCVEVLLELCACICKALDLSIKMLPCVKPYLASDIAVSRNLLDGALNGAKVLIHINLRMIKDKKFAEMISDKLSQLNADNK